MWSFLANPHAYMQRLSLQLFGTSENSVRLYRIDDTKYYMVEFANIRSISSSLTSRMDLEEQMISVIKSHLGKYD